MCKLPYSIVEVNKDDRIKACVTCINQAFKIVADRFELTENNAPNNGAFLKFGKLKSEISSGAKLYALTMDNQVIGTVCIKQVSELKFEVTRLAVLPRYRRGGFGRLLMKYVECEVLQASNQGTAFTLVLQLGCIAEDRELIEFYESIGYVKVKIKRFKKLPHKVCFMRKMVKA